MDKLKSPRKGHTVHEFLMEPRIGGKADMRDLRQCWFFCRDQQSLRATQRRIACSPHAFLRGFDQPDLNRASDINIVTECACEIDRLQIISPSAEPLQ